MLKKFLPSISKEFTVIYILNIILETHLRRWLCKNYGDCLPGRFSVLLWVHQLHSSRKKWGLLSLFLRNGLYFPYCLQSWWIWCSSLKTKNENRKRALKKEVVQYRLYLIIFETSKTILDNITQVLVSLLVKHGFVDTLRKTLMRPM